MIALEYTYSPADVAARDAHRATHRAWLQAQIDAGILMVAGAYSDQSGALFLINGDNAEAARELFANDPFVIEGLVTEQQYKIWNPPLGRLG